jgi:hypothetical protein
MSYRAVLLTTVAACTAEPAAPLGGGELLDDGYIRYTPAPVILQPGETAQYVQWVSAPADRDLDLIDVRGSQSAGGHHAVVYASPDLEPIGTTRVWQAADQITARFLGGVGGEGATASGGLPAGAVLRIPAGSALYVQSHYLNTGDEVLEGSSVVEIKVVEPSPDVTVLSLFVSSTLSIDVPPGVSEQTLSCAIQEDTPLVMYVNHVHERGTAISTELRASDGSILMVKDDPAWNYEWATRPNFNVLELDAAFVAPVGATLVTRCHWDNKTGAALTFPDEMCGFLGFYIGDRDRACANGQWIEL